MIHKLADVQTKNIGDKTNIWQFTVVLAEAKIGKNCNIWSHCFIQNKVTIGNNVTIKNYVSIYDHMIIEDDVFIGTGAILCDDQSIHATASDFFFGSIIIRSGAVIGANATILPKITIGENAVIAPGSIITKDVPANEHVSGTY